MHDMNEKIKELAEQAVNDTQLRMIMEYKNFESKLYERFAELIIDQVDVQIIKAAHKASNNLSDDDAELFVTAVRTYFGQLAIDKERNNRQDTDEVVPKYSFGDAAPKNYAAYYLAKHVSIVAGPFQTIDAAVKAKGQFHPMFASTLSVVKSEINAIPL
jgi:hypothetical protein